MDDPIKGEFVLYEFLDSDMWTHLDALLIKLGVQTLLLPARHFNIGILGLQRSPFLSSFQRYMVFYMYYIIFMVLI